MKRIIAFLLLFAALKVAGQTTGYLRFDTVKITKQGGTCELYIINKTKDSLGLLTNVGGGLTQFKRSRAINDSTIIVGNDTLVIHGASGGSSTTITNAAAPGDTILISNTAKRLVAGYGVTHTVDATSITSKVDTGATGLATQYDLTQVTAVPGGSDTHFQFNDGGVFGGNSGATYNKTTRRSSFDTTFTKKLEVNVTTDFTFDTVIVFSDSYGFGVTATDVAHSWPRIMAAELQLVLKNYSISGSTLMKRVPIDPYGGSPQNLVDQIAALGSTISKTARRKYIIIAKGLNDIGWNSANYTATNYSTDYQSIISTLLGLGWAINEIIMITPWYIGTAGMASYASTTSTTQATFARHREFCDTVTAIANRLGALTYDINASEANNGDIRLLANADAIHPTNPGHAYIGTQIAAAIRSLQSVRRNNQAAAMNGITEMRKARLAFPDTLYDGGFLPNILARDSSGMIVVMKNNGVILNNTGTLANASQIHINGKIIQNTNGLTSPSITDAAQILSNGGLKVGWAQITTTLPGGMTGSGVEIGKVGANGYLGAYDRSGAAALNLFLQGLGGIVSVGAFTTSGSQPFQALGSYFNGTVGIGVNAPARKLDVLIDDGSNNTPTYIIRGIHTTSGTPGAGIATGIELGNETSTGVTTRVGSIWESVATVVTNAAERNDQRWLNISAGSLVERLRLTDSGTLKINGFRSGTGNIVVVGADSLLRQATPAALGLTTGNTLYTGDGTATNRTVTISGFVNWLSGEMKIGSATDNGSYTLQNTGGWYQKGSGLVDGSSGKLNLNNGLYDAGHGSILLIGGTVNDPLTAGSGSRVMTSTTEFDRPTLTATNSSVTNDTAATVHIEGAPIAGTNMTITKPYSLKVDKGVSYFGGGIQLKDIPASSGTPTILTHQADSNTAQISLSALRLALGLQSGSYIPTFTNVANVSSFTLSDAQFERNDSICIVYITLNMDPTTASTSTQFYIEIPIPSNFTQSYDATGFITCIVSGEESNGHIAADNTVATDRVFCTFICGAGNNTTYRLHYMYKIK